MEEFILPGLFLRLGIHIAKIPRMAAKKFCSSSRQRGRLFFGK
jgi:hypothetical protein